MQVSGEARPNIQCDLPDTDWSAASWLWEISQQSIASWADRRSLDLNRSSPLCQWVHNISHLFDCSLSLRLCLYPSLSSVIYCFVYYLWVGHNYCYAYLSGFTALFLLPGETNNNETSIYIYSRNVLSVELGYRDGQIFYLDLSCRLSGWGPQWLSYLWYLSDGGIRRKSLTWTHILHLGLFKRWAILVCVQERQFPVKVCQGLFTFDVYDDKKRCLLWHFFLSLLCLYPGYWSAWLCPTRTCTLRSCSRPIAPPYVCSRPWWSPSLRRCCSAMCSSVLT